MLLDPDGTTPIDAGLARAVCDRHRGVGADGLIRVTRPAVTAGRTAGELGFELRNADGSPAEMSGNGMRCLAQAAVEAGLASYDQAVVVATPAGPRSVTVWATDRPDVVWARVDMGRASIDGGDSDRCNVGHGRLLVNLGNPHLVILGPDPATVAVDRLAPSWSGRCRAGATSSSSPWAPAPTRSPCGCGSGGWARPRRAAPAPALPRSPSFIGAAPAGGSPSISRAVTPTSSCGPTAPWCWPGPASGLLPARSRSGPPARAPPPGCHVRRRATRPARAHS